VRPEPNIYALKMKVLKVELDKIAGKSMALP